MGIEASAINIINLKSSIWAIERELAEDTSRPIIFYTRAAIFYTRAATCWHSRVKGVTMMVNSVFNGWRMEDVWLDR